MQKPPKNLNEELSGDLISRINTKMNSANDSSNLNENTESETEYLDELEYLRQENSQLQETIRILALQLEEQKNLDSKKIDYIVRAVKNSTIISENQKKSNVHIVIGNSHFEGKMVRK